MKNWIIALLIISGLLVSADRVNAIFINTPAMLNTNGTVLSVSSNNISISTSGSQTINIDINNRTRIINTPINPGDFVSVVARRNSNNYMAIVIMKLSSGGYGVPPHTPAPNTPTPTSAPSYSKYVVVMRATVLSKTANTLVVRNDNIDIVFQITGNSKFLKKTFAQITAGNIVSVTGIESDGQFTAKIVISLR